MTEKKKQGAQLGSQNAYKGGMDGQILVKLPKAMRDQAINACRRTGDKGLSALIRRLLADEIERVIMDDALASAHAKFRQ